MQIGTKISKVKRLVAGFLLAPLLPSIIYYIAETSLIRDGDDSAIVIFLVSGYLAVIFLGLPSYFIMQHQRKVSLAAHIVMGFVIALLIFLVYLYFLLSHVAFPFLVLRDTYGIFILISAFSVPASAIFWFIAIKE